ncbi:glutamine synthetase family protein [Paracoccus litorisediminis]|uniref:Glutamine synthetase n=1 Tax=Paracoccus litorisediminis TaxID=2006130 RepID=A0A844HUN0_9RHOB|nr:glutamine synthetase family protein [Paracoccus litorisediminis]MTH62047.1 glutamine synthetase [Paracoccus litorisediminis]
MTLRTTLTAPRSAGLHTGDPAAFYAAIFDMNGILRGKRLPLSHLSKVLSAGTRMPLSSIGVDIWGTDVAGTRLTLERGDLDGCCLPTGRGLLDLGWPGNPFPLLPLWMTCEDGSPYLGDARHLLAAVLARYAALELTPVVATEVEFYLTDPAAATSGSDSIYAISELAGMSAFLDDVYAVAAACGISVEAATAEGAPGQFEFNLVHQPDAMKAAEDTLFFRQIIRNAARRHGHEASFMAKPFGDHAGSGLHVHFSVLDAKGQNIFSNGTPEGSAMLRHAVAGQLATLADLSLAFAPHLNSYRRLAPGGLAPTRIGWGYENRTSALRIPAGPDVARRIEHRVSGADANPFVVLAAILGGALHGITQQLSPPPPISTNAHVEDQPRIAKDWPDALERFRRVDLVGQILHPDFVAAFAACKQQEQEVFAAHVSDFEMKTYRLAL